MLAWTYLDGAGRTVGGSPSFDDRDVAEEWLSGSWEDLVERGIERVVLVDRALHQTVYTMSLRAKEE